MLVILSIFISSTTILPAFAQGTPTNQVYYWGNKSKGGPQCSGSTCYETPQLVNNLSNVVKIDASNTFNLALLNDGTVMAWGNNKNGQLGNGTTFNGYTPPVQVSGLSNVTATATGNDDSFALLSDGTVMSWGLNYDGSLGNGTKQNSSVPKLIPNLNGVIALAAGGNHACALLSNGTIKCWGGNSYGQLGDNSTHNSLIPVLVSGINSAIAISSGNQFVDALLNNDMLWIGDIMHSVNWGMGQQLIVLFLSR